MYGSILYFIPEPSATYLSASARGTLVRRRLIVCSSTGTAPSGPAALSRLTIFTPFSASSVSNGSCSLLFCLKNSIASSIVASSNKTVGRIVSRNLRAMYSRPVESSPPPPTSLPSTDNSGT